MTVSISARFNSRDMADHAVNQLRHNGIAFSVAHVGAVGLPENTRPSGGPEDIPEIFGRNAVNWIDSSNHAPYPAFGYRSAARTPGEGRTGGILLKLKVRSDQLERARDAIRSSGGKDIRIGI